VVKNNGGASGTFDLTATCFPAESCSGPTAPVTLGAGAQTTVAVNYTSGGPSTTGKVQLLATLSGGTAKDSGWINVTSTSSGAQVAPQVSVADPDPILEPALCLTIASGTHGAYECGSLRLIHALPATRTMGTLRVPTLYYNSEQAQPTPLVAANVTLPSGAATPDTVTASVTLNGQTWTRKWPGGSWTSGNTTRRTVVPLDGYPLSSTVSTSIPSYTITVSNCYNGLGCQAASAQSGKLVLVDRSASPFGAGWWLAGLERLDPATMIWTGGDGSVRQYAAAGTNIWRAPSVDRPDSITRDPASGNYTRYLPHAARVIFNSAGQHAQTINRLGQVTSFGYSGGQLQSITLPVVNGAAPIYTFVFNGSQAQVTAPPVNGQSRITTLLLSGGRVMTIRDPDYAAPNWPATGFAYDGTNRIIARTNKLGAATSFGYANPGRRLAADSVQLTASPLRYAVRSFNSAEARGAAVPTPTDSIYTYVNGPRADTNIVSVWIDRFGAPTQVRDAVGKITQLFRTNTVFPALVTELRTPNGPSSVLISRAGYDSHGNAASDTVVSPFGGADAVTQYGWDLRFDFLTTVTPPTGPSTSMAYDAIGNRLWQQTGSDANRRVTFEYNATSDGANGLLRAVVTPKAGGASMRDSVFYDGLGNLYKTKSPMGRWSFVVRDGIGRDTLSITPIRATDSDSAPNQTKRVLVRRVYDLMDRVSVQQSIGAADTVLDVLRNQWVISTTERDSVQTTYDLEGRPLNVLRSSWPDVALVGQLMTQWQYDLAGRQLVEIAPDNATDHHTYDDAGNATTWTNRKNQIVRMQYDALNRLIQRTTPRDSTPVWTDPYVGWVYSASVIAEDTATFTYAPLGGIATANNRSAKVSRAYFPNGAIQADTQRIRTWDPNGSFELHKYVVGYGYDLAGRRTTLQIPSILIAPNYSNSVSYGYDPSTGLLTTVSDVEARVFRYHHDLAGRLDSLITPVDPSQNAVTTAYSYDDDGALLKRIQMHGATQLHRDSLIYDGRGKATLAYTPIDTTFTAYSGLGNLIFATHRSPTGYQNWEESFTVDALGNQQRKQSSGFQGLHPMNGDMRYTYTAGRLTSSVDQQYGSAHQSLFDAAGNRTMAYSETGGTLEEARSYYAPDGKLGKVDRRVCNGDCTMKRGAYEDYRYDALGRRVLVRSQRVWCTSGGDCWSNIERVIWDGDQILGEIRMPGYGYTGVDTLEADTLTFHPKFGPSCPPLPPPEGCNPADTLPSIAPWYGHVTYIHGTSIDQPLELIRGGFHSDMQDQIALVPHLNWRGLYDNGTFLQGGPIMKWPASSTEILKNDLDADDDPGNWFGGLIRGNRDAGGSLYMRNRYYDAATGRFTQEDPIGLAGGLNLYGFANGDPVNYSDPLGLLACPPDCGWEGDPKNIEREVRRLEQSTPKEKLGLVAIGLAAATGGLALAAGAELLLGSASAVAAAGPLLPTVPSAMSKLEALAERFGVSASEIANQAITSGTKLLDHLPANAGNVNAVIPRLDGASGFIRVTLDPSQSRIISAGLMSANQIANGLSSGRFTAIK
jgi:RHS repeat-associated protein